MRKPASVLLSIYSSLIVLTVSTTSTALAQAGRSRWSPSAEPILDAYLDGQLSVARDAASRLLSRETLDPQLRDEARALHAMTLLRSAERDTIRVGLGQLGQLAADNPEVANRPEPLLAYGAGLAQLDENGEALVALQRAAEGFAATGRPERQAAALLKAAEVWLKFNGWSVAPPALRVPENPDRLTAARIRQSKLREIDEQLDALPGAAANRAAMAVVRAEHLMAQNPPDVDGAIQLLQPHAEVPPASPDAAQAQLRLAEIYSAEKQYAEALALYEQLAAAAPGRIAETARKAAAEMRAPAVEIDMPEQIGTSELLGAYVRSRNVNHLRVELRRVDLGAWLQEQRGRFAPQRLPASGAVLATNELSLESAPQCAWTRQAAFGTADQPQPGPGAYVLTATAPDVAPPLTVKGLVLVSDLKAVAVVGAQRGGLAVWPAAEAAPPQARLWLEGSFQPTKITLDGHLATFELPPEVHVMRTERFALLIEQGTHAALCRGPVPSAGPDGLREVTLRAGPNELSPGQPLQVAGMISTDARPRPLRIELTDERNRVRAHFDVLPSGRGLFTKRFTLPAALSDTTVNVVVRSGGRVLTNRAGVQTVRVLPGDQIPAEMTGRLTADAHESPARFVFEGEARFDWGVAVPDCKGRGILQSFVVDEAGSIASPAPNPNRTSDVIDGRVREEWPTQLLELPTGRTITGHRFLVSLPTGHSLSTNSTLISSAAAPLAVVQLDPLRPTLGTVNELKATVYADRPDRLLPTPLTLSMRDRNRQSAPLATLYQPGPTLTHWVPQRAEPYALRMERHDDQTAVVTRPVDVAGRAVPVVVGEAVFSDNSHRRVRVRVNPVTGAAAVAAFVRSGGDPIHAGMVRADGTRQALDLSRPPREDASLSLVALLEEGRVTVTHLPIAAPKLDIRVEPSGTEPDGARRIRISRAGTRGATRSARLLLWLEELRPPGTLLPPQRLRATGAAAKEATIATALPTAISDQRTPPEINGTTNSLVWAGSGLLLDAPETVTVPCADAGRDYLLLVEGRGGGATARHTIPLPARSAVSLRTNLPPYAVLGDRFFAGVRLHNHGPEPRTVHVELSGNAAIAIEQIGRTASSVGSNAEAGGAAREVRIPPHTTVFVQANVEAARTGQATLTATAKVIEDKVTSTAVCDSSFEPAREIATDTAHTVRREVFLLTPLEQHTARAPAAPGWRGDPRNKPRNSLDDYLRERLSPDDRIPVNSLLLVRDTLPANLAAQRLSQRLPATCIDTRREPDGLRRTGALRERRLQSLSFEYQDAAGTVVHEYAMFAARPGVAAFPPPELGGDEGTQPLLTTSPRYRLRVVQP